MKIFIARACLTSSLVYEVLSGGMAYAMFSGKPPESFAPAPTVRVVNSSQMNTESEESPSPLKRQKLLTGQAVSTSLAPPSNTEKRKNTRQATPEEIKTANHPVPMDTIESNNNEAELSSKTVCTTGPDGEDQWFFEQTINGEPSRSEPMSTQELQPFLAGKCMVRGLDSLPIEVVVGVEDSSSVLQYLPPTDLLSFGQTCITHRAYVKAFLEVNQFDIQVTPATLQEMMDRLFLNPNSPKRRISLPYPLCFRFDVIGCYKKFARYFRVDEKSEYSFELNYADSHMRALTDDDSEELVQILPWAQMKTLGLGGKHRFTSLGLGLLFDALKGTELRNLDFCGTKLSQRELEEQVYGDYLYKTDIAHNSACFGVLIAAAPWQSLRSLCLGEGMWLHLPLLMKKLEISNAPLRKLTLSATIGSDDYADPSYHYDCTSTLKNFFQGLPGTKIDTLDLSYNDLNDDLAFELAQVIPQTQLTKLDVSYCLLNDNGVEALINASRNTDLKGLDWNQEELSDEFLQRHRDD